MDAYASGAATTDRSGAYYYGPQGAQNAPDRISVRPQYDNQYSRGQNLPYPDRPYGDPDSDWYHPTKTPAAMPGFSSSPKRCRVRLTS